MLESYAWLVSGRYCQISLPMRGGVPCACIHASCMRGSGSRRSRREASPSGKTKWLMSSPASGGGLACLSPRRAPQQQLLGDGRAEVLFGPAAFFSLLLRGPAAARPIASRPPAKQGAQHVRDTFTQPGILPLGTTAAENLHQPATTAGRTSRTAATKPCSFIETRLTTHRTACA
jgi:hypothetical protein